MHAAPAMKAVLEADATIISLLRFLPNDTRPNVVYTTWLTEEESPDAFMPASGGTLWPSIFVHPGGAPKRHPQDWRIPGLTALYPQVWVYAPMLRGIDYRTITRRVLQRSRVLLEDLLITDPDTGFNGRLGWWGDVDGRKAEEYFDTWSEHSTYQYRALWREP